MKKIVGMLDGEIFLVDMDGDTPHLGCNLVPIYGVLRYVDRDTMRYFQTDSDSVRDLWVEAVRTGFTTDGLDNYFNGLDIDSVWEDEGWPYKDESYCECLDDEHRKAADEWLQANKGIEVGTWECSGLYPPESLDFDLLFCEPEFLDRLKEIHSKANTDQEK